MNQLFREHLVPAEDGYDQAKLAETEEKLRKLDRRDWWLWTMAVIVMLLLTFAVFSLSFPGLFRMDDPFFQYSLDRAVRGLIGLVLIFNAYTIYQQVSVKRLRRQFSERIAEMRILQNRAQQYQRLALIDPLTGLSNRRGAEERLAAEASRARRNGFDLTVISFDLDKFKQINDAYGHPAGDLVLKEFAARLKEVTRQSDLAARMGGDEFVILLPECPNSQVEQLLSRLRGMEVAWNGQEIPISFSAGWVGYQRGESTEEFLARADRTLYAEKRASQVRAQEPVAAV